MTQYEKGIIDYYESCDVDYKIVWHLDSSMAMHYGYWEPDVRRLREALNRMNIKLAEFSGIKYGSSVLDAGCGVGGSSIFLAKKLGCNIMGITLSDKQVAQCQLNADRHNVLPQLHFEVGNYCETRFADASFDAIWAIESVVYAEDKRVFLNEAFRLLKPGGILAVADVFRKNLDSRPDKLKLMRLLASTWAIRDFEIAEAFQEKMELTGFRQIQWKDVSENIYPSIRRLHLYYYPGVFCYFFLRAMGRRKMIHRKNLGSTLLQYRTFMQDLWTYNFFVGKKDF